VKFWERRPSTDLKLKNEQEMVLFQRSQQHNFRNAATTIVEIWWLLVNTVRKELVEDRLRG
jgi:hypothetical protein